MSGMRGLLLGLVILGLAQTAQAQPADGQLVSSRPCPPRTESYDAWVAARLKDYEEEARLGLEARIPQPPTDRFRNALIARAEY
ncbi:hypothetical protein, partial [Phenylobacterium sp.]|uniref:hypothetical protein n=1 Tax=Phenylobacterium sp. TaxID=1871053 RepID=UPI002E2F8272